jgi:hypothetical protein
MKPIQLPQPKRLAVAVQYVLLVQRIGNPGLVARVEVDARNGLMVH